MARAGVAEELVKLAKRGCSYRTAAVMMCFVNIIAVFFVVRTFFVSYHDIPSPLTSYSEGTVDQKKRVEDSIRLRQASEPVELIRLVKELNHELSKKSERCELPKPLQRILRDEILERLKGLKNDLDVAAQREVVELWRSEKLEAIGKMLWMNSTSNSSITLEEAKIIEKALKHNWLALSENLGLYIPPNISSNKNIDESEIEDIIPGRPLPPECHAELHTDYGGAAVRWGLTHHTESAADCCQECLDQARWAKPGEMKCNIWVYCPLETGCHSPDIYEHKHQECWLKQADVSQINFKNTYSDSYRSTHPDAPFVVPWISGIVKA